MRNKSLFLELIKSQWIKGFIRYLPLLSLALTNIILLIIARHFFRFYSFSLFNRDISLSWLFLVIGIFLSIVLVRTKYVLHFKEDTKKKQDAPIERVSSQGEVIKTDKGVIWNTACIFIKSLFFNILNDMLITSIFWVGFGSGLYAVGLMDVQQTFKLDTFVAAITILGILAGFFQFYIQNYKSEVSASIIKSITNYIQMATRDITFKDFVGFIDSKKNNKDYESLFSRINKIILDEEKIKNNRLPNVKIIQQIALSFKTDPFSLFDYLDYYKEFGKSDSLNKQHLKRAYEDYFAKKLTEFKESLDKKELIEIKRGIFSSLLFFEEIAANLEELNFDYPEEKEDSIDFRDFYRKFINDCMFYLLDILLNLKHPELENHGKTEIKAN